MSCSAERGIVYRVLRPRFFHQAHRDSICSFLSLIDQCLFLFDSVVASHRSPLSLAFIDQCLIPYRSVPLLLCRWQLHHIDLRITSISTFLIVSFRFLWLCSLGIDLSSSPNSHVLSFLQPFGSSCISFTFGVIGSPCFLPIPSCLWSLGLEGRWPGFGFLLVGGTTFLSWVSRGGLCFIVIR